MSVVSIDARDRTPIYTQLERGIRAAMATGRLRPGDQLPTVRQLAVDLKINAKTVARVYSELERAGAIETRRGVGSFVTATAQKARPPKEHDKRLRALCEAVLRAPSQRATLAEWASEVGASERTVARLFREELGTSYQQWRQQAILAHALPMLARGVPVSHVAASSGYASDSAFSAMFKAAMGQPPSVFQRRD